MSTKRIAVFFGIALIALLAFFLLTSLGSTKADQGGTRAQGDYQGADSCQSCHSEEYTGWSETNHGKVFDPSSAFYQYWVSRGRPDSCQPCHVAGYNQTSIGGYDPSQAWNSSHNLPLLGIQCENCHGPDTMSLPDDERWNTSAEVCMQCHYGSRRPQYDEWNTSAHASGVPSFVQRLECAECHEAKLAGEYVSTHETPTALPPNPRWQLTCSTCHDPHDATNERMLRQPVYEICAVCHTSEGAQPGDAVHHSQAEMRSGSASVPVASQQAMSAVYCVQCHMYSRAYNSSFTPPAVAGHDFNPKPEACVSCHDGESGFLMTLEQAENSIEGWQTGTSNSLAIARARINEAFTALNDANNYGFSTTILSQAWMFYDQANYSANFVEADGSMGAHNFDYANDLLSYADMKAGETIMMITPGTLSGTILDANGNPVSGVQISLDGKVWATTGSNGKFSFMHAPGSFTFTLLQGGNDVGAFDAAIFTGQTSNVQARTGAAPSGGAVSAGASETLQYAILLLLIIVIILVIVLMAKKSKPAAAESKEYTPAPPEPVEKQTP